MANIEQLVAENRLGRIIAMLGSDKDGEVLAAVAALKRTLNASGGDLHDLVALLEGKVRVVYSKSSTPLLWRDKVAACLKEWNFLNEWEKDFIQKLSMQRYIPTEKQAAVLNKLYNSLFT